MSGEATVTPGYGWPDNDTISLAKLRLAAAPTVRLNESSVGARELNAIDLVNVIGDSVVNQNFLVHGNFDEPSWRRGIGPQTAAAGQESRLHENWLVKPAGAAVTVERSTTVPSANKLSIHSIKVTGATGATTVDLGQDIERHVSAALRGNVTFSCWIYNGTGGAVVPHLRLDTADAADDFTAVSNRADIPLQSCANAGWTQVSGTIDATGLTNMANGLRVLVRLLTGTMDAGAKSATFSQLKLERGTVATPFAVSPDPDDPLLPQPNLLLNGNFPEPAWVGTGSPASCPAGSETSRIDGWYVRPAGAAATCERGDLVPDSLSLHSIKLTGASGVTTVDIGQNVVRYLAAEMRRTLTFSVWIRNVTGISFTPQLRVSTADAADVFSATTVRLTQSLDLCAIATWVQVKWTFDPTAYTNIGNGLRIELRIPSSALASGTDAVYISQAKLELGANLTPMIPDRRLSIQRFALKWRTRGLKIVANVATPASKLDITADEAILSDSGGKQIFADSVAVTIDLAASGAGGLDTGARAAGSWYYVWLISDGNTLSAVFSLSTTSPTLPAGYIYSARISAIYNESGNTLVLIVQRDNVIWTTSRVVFSALAPTTINTYQSASLADFVPAIATTVLGTIGSTDNNNPVGWGIAANAAGLAEHILGALPGTAAGIFGTWSNAFPFELPLKTAQTLYWKAATTAAQNRLMVRGYTI